ncbi:TPA: S-layer homology domain-containing protein [Bacillus cereus]
MKIVKIATTGMIALGSLAIPSSSLAEIENSAKNKIDFKQYMVKDEEKALQDFTSKLNDIKVEKEKLLILQDLLKQKDKLFEQEDELEIQLKEMNGDVTSIENKEGNETLQKQFDEISKKQKEIQLKLMELQQKDASAQEEHKQNEEEKLLPEELEQKKLEKEKQEREDNQKQLKELEAQLVLLQQKEIEIKDQEDRVKKEIEARQEQGNKEIDSKVQVDEKIAKETEIKVPEEKTAKDIEVQKDQVKTEAPTEQIKTEDDAQQEQPSSVQAASSNFPDVPNWVKPSVDYLMSKNVLTGMPDGTFGPNVEIDRGSAAIIMAKILELPIDPSAKPSFNDSQKHWATPYIAAVEKAGVIRGEGNGKFNPTGKLTRGAMASMLVNAYKLQEKVTGNPPTLFNDLKNHWSEKYVNILVELGISSGYGDDNWKPDQTITRAETVSLVARTDTSKDKELKRKQIEMPKNFFTYHGASLSSGIASEYTPQTVTVYEEREDGWVKIHTNQGFKWITLKEKRIELTKNFFTYNEASLSSGIAFEYEPQPVTVYEEKPGGWIKIHTGLGYKWVLLNEKKVYIDKRFTTYDNPSRTANTLVTYDPQTVTVVEEKGTWLRIRTYAGLQWMNTQKETKYLSRVFFAYDSPNFSSRVSEKFAPQTVEVISERDGGWIQISTGQGLKWVNQANINSNTVILNVPARYQFPELYNGCEVVSLQMLVEYYTGRSVNKVNFAFQMPFDNTRLQKQGGQFKVWGDPDVGFVGDVTGRTPGYAINPGPLKQLLDQYARGTNLTGNNFSVLESYVRNGKPVVTWVTVALNNPRPTVTWKTPQGKTIYARMNTHAVVLTGVDDNYVYYNDPFYGTKNVKISKARFESIYNQMGKKALSID